MPEAASPRDGAEAFVDGSVTHSSAPVAAFSAAGAPRLDEANIVVPTTVGGLSTEPVLNPGLIAVLQARARPLTFAGEICVSVE